VQGEVRERGQVLQAHQGRPRRAPGRQELPLLLAARGAARLGAASAAPALGHDHGASWPSSADGNGMDGGPYGAGPCRRRRPAGPQLLVDVRVRLRVRLGRRRRRLWCGGGGPQRGRVRQGDDGHLREDDEAVHGEARRHAARVPGDAGAVRGRAHGARGGVAAPGGRPHEPRARAARQGARRRGLPRRRADRVPPACRRGAGRARAAPSARRRRRAPAAYAGLRPSVASAPRGRRLASAAGARTAQGGGGLGARWRRGRRVHAVAVAQGGSGGADPDAEREGREVPRRGGQGAPLGGHRRRDAGDRVQPERQAVQGKVGEHQQVLQEGEGEQQEAPRGLQDLSLLPPARRHVPQQTPQRHRRQNGTQNEHGLRRRRRSNRAGQSEQARARGKEQQRCRQPEE
jgi:hypothetical protein